MCHLCPKFSTASSASRGAHWSRLADVSFLPRRTDHSWRTLCNVMRQSEIDAILREILLHCWCYYALTLGPAGPVIPVAPASPVAP